MKPCPCTLAKFILFNVSRIVSHVYELPSDFDFTAEHTLTVQKKSNRFFVYLDGGEEPILSKQIKGTEINYYYGYDGYNADYTASKISSKAIYSAYDEIAVVDENETNWRVSGEDQKSWVFADSKISLAAKDDDNTLDSLAVYATPEQLTAMAFRYPSSFNDGDTMYYIKISSPQPITGAVPIAVIVSGEDAQVAVRAFSSTIFVNGQGDSRWSDAEISHNVHAPACFEGVVAVGSTIHRTGFTNYLGAYRDYTQAGRNDGVWSVYSSVGPTLDGRIKPDVVAPGNNIISSYSSYYIEANPNASDVNSDVEHFDYNGRTYAWNANTGTSMATPVVAGAVALWLQANPKLTPDDVIKIISKTSRLPESGMDYPNNKYGHGEIDVYKGLLEVLNLSDIKEISKNEASNVRACFADDGNLCLSFNKAPNKTFSVTLYSISGRLLNKTIFKGNNSTTEYRVSVPKLIDGVYLVQFSGASFAPSSMLVRK